MKANDSANRQRKYCEWIQLLRGKDGVDALDKNSGQWSGVRDWGEPLERDGLYRVEVWVVSIPPLPSAGAGR